MTKSDAKKYGDLKRGVFSEALTYAGLYQKQCKLFHRNAELEDKFAKAFNVLYKLIESAELEQEYEDWCKSTYGDDVQFKIV